MRNKEKDKKNLADTKIESWLAGAEEDRKNGIHLSTICKTDEGKPDGELIYLEADPV